MSTIGRDEVLHVAKLAALEVPEGELPRLVEQMRRIVDMVEQLGEVPADGDEAPFVAGPVRAELREDRVAPEPLAHPPERVAPGFAAGFFSVPRHAAMEGGE